MLTVTHASRSEADVRLSGRRFYISISKLKGAVSCAGRAGLLEHDTSEERAVPAIFTPGSSPLRFSRAMRVCTRTQALRTELELVVEFARVFPTPYDGRRTLRYR